MIEYLIDWRVLLRIAVDIDHFDLFSGGCDDHIGRTDITKMQPSYLELLDPRSQFIEDQEELLLPVPHLGRPCLPLGEFCLVEVIEAFEHDLQSIHLYAHFIVCGALTAGEVLLDMLLLKRISNEQRLFVHCTGLTIPILPFRVLVLSQQRLIDNYKLLVEFIPHTDLLEVEMWGFDVFFAYSLAHRILLFAIKVGG